MKWLARLLLYLTGMLLLLEIGLRCFWTNPATAVKFPSRAVTLRENQRGADQAKTYQGKPFRFQTDPDGFVWPSRTVPEHPFYMAFLGDSSMEAAQLPEELRWTNIVINTLRSKGWFHLDALNDSHAGATARDAVQLFYNKDAFFRPRILLYSSGFTDLAYNFSLGKDVPRLQEMAPPPAPQSFYLLAFFEQRYSQAPANPVQTSGAPGQSAMYDVDTHPAVESYGRNLEILILLARQLNCRVYLITQASTYGSGWMTREPGKVATLRFRDGGLSESCMERSMKDVNQTIRAVAKKCQVDCIDVADGVGTDPAMFIDEVHLSERGQKVVSELVVKRLLADYPTPPSEPTAGH